MKIINLFFSALFMAVLVSCSSGAGPKKITPTSTEFTSGELARYIEVVDQPSELTFAEKDGAIATQYIRLKVTLRMTKDGFNNVDARDIGFTSLLSVAVINLVDENGTTVQDLSVKSEDMLKLKKLLTKSKGDTEVIVFEGEYNNSNDAPKWFEQATHFTPYLTGDISVEGSSFEDDSDGATESNGTVNLKGAIDKYPITMQLAFDGNVINGTYFYNSQGANALLHIVGIKDGNKLDLTETNEQGQPTGHFVGVFDDDEFKGQFVNYKGEKMNFIVSKNGTSIEDALNAFDIGELPDDFESLPDLDDDYSFDDGPGDPKIDKLLDNYEEFMEEYIAYAKKIKNNDQSALANYEKMMEKYLKMTDDMDKVKGNMSLKQMERLNSITTKITSAMRDMR